MLPWSKLQVLAAAFLSKVFPPVHSDDEPLTLSIGDQEHPRPP